MANSFSDDLKKVVLAGIGATALTMEKSKELIEKLIEKGELTADQSKELIKKLVEKGELTAEQGKKFFDSLVEKGELSVKKGKEVNEELKHSIKGKISEINLKSVLSNMDKMSKEELEKIKEKLSEMEKGKEDDGESQ